MDEIFIMLELSTVSDAVELMLHLQYNPLHFLRVNFSLALHSKIYEVNSLIVIKMSYLVTGPV